MTGTNPQDHIKGCPYLEWYENNARWQPAGPMSEMAREVMVEVSCTCDSGFLEPLTDAQKELLRTGGAK